MQNKWLVIWIVCLLLVSAGLPVWHHFGMNRALVFGAANNYPLSPYDDRGLGGGSVGTATRTPGAIVLQCQIKAGYAWPYCAYSETIAPIRPGNKTPSDHGFDLSGFKTAVFDISVTGPMPVPIRIYLRNFNSAYSQPRQTETLKINTLTYVPEPDGKPFVVPLSNFQVVSWWIQQFHISPQNSSPDLSNVVVLDVSTGDGLVPGNYTVKVNSITFHGKWLSVVQLLTTILVLWLISALLFLAFSFWQARRIAVLANQRKRELEGINAALELKQHELEHTANHDELTGAYSRVGLRNQLFDAVSGAKHSKGPLSIVFMDIDHFKEVNDRHGHCVGDEILQQFASFVMGHVREGDFLCRWGGEEFILLCAGTSLDVASRTAERLRLLMASQTWPAGVQLHCSFGVAEMLRFENMGVFIQRADEALYRAKRAGRNRVAVAHPRPVAVKVTNLTGIQGG